MPTVVHDPARPPRPRRRPRARRLGPERAHRRPPPRLARNARRPRRDAVDRHHQPTAARAMARLPGDPTVADAILERVIHRAHALALTGPSRRKEAGTRTAAAEAEALDAAGAEDTDERCPPLLGTPQKPRCPTIAHRRSSSSLHPQEPQHRTARLPKEVTPHTLPTAQRRVAPITPARGAGGLDGVITMPWTD